MTLLASKRYALGLSLICGGAWLTAVGCGSSDNKKAAPSAEAGAAGVGEGGGGQAGTAAGGAPSEPVGGVAGQSVGGAAGETSLGGMPGSAGAGPSGGAGGEPAALCVAEGSVTALTLDSEPIYQGCRGAILKVEFFVELAADNFTCCGVSTSAPAFTLPLNGVYNHDGGGMLAFLVPVDAAVGSYALNVTCQTQPDEQVIALEISDSPAPVVDSITEEVPPGGQVHITGQNLLGVTGIIANSADGVTVSCDFQDIDQTDTGIDCTLPTGIPLTTYTLDVVSASCGWAASSPTFVVATPG